MITKVTIKLKARYILNLKEKVVKTFTIFSCQDDNYTIWICLKKSVGHFFDLIVKVLLCKPGSHNSIWGI